MIDLSGFPLLIAVERQEAGEWFSPVLEAGRLAAFTDTGFLRALIQGTDQWTDYAREHYEGAQGTNLYTTTLVVAELARQLAKDGSDSQKVRREWFAQCRALIVGGGARVLICSPPRDLVIDAYKDLVSLRDSMLPSLDLCDVVSVHVLRHARHSRVFGFDLKHFSAFGARLEPLP